MFRILRTWTYTSAGLSPNRSSRPPNFRLPNSRPSINGYHVVGPANPIALPSLWVYEFSSWPRSLVLPPQGIVLTGSCEWNDCRTAFILATHALRVDVNIMLPNGKTTRRPRDNML